MWQPSVHAASLYFFCALNGFNEFCDITFTAKIVYNNLVGCSRRRHTVFLANSVGQVVNSFDECSLMCAGGPGSPEQTTSTQDSIPPWRGRSNEQQPVFGGATEDCGVEARGRKMVTCDLCSQRRTLPHVVPLRLARAS